MKLYEILRKYGDTAASIRRWHDGAFLLQVAPEGGAYDKFQTLSGEPGEGSAAPVQAAELAAHPIAKRDGTAFARMISVGRVETLDIRIASPRVSKMHAYFMLEDDLIFVVDTGSHNGTYINNMSIPAKTKTTVEIGDDICFGRTDRYRVIDADELARKLAELSTAKA